MNLSFLAVVEHTNFMDKKFYNNEHLVYIANYLPHEHPYFRRDKLDLFKEFFPYLKTINPKMDKSWIDNIYLFKAYFAQPIIPLYYSRKLPSIITPIKGLYLSNMQQVYPWDRGTNYAVENGQKVAQLVLKSNSMKKSRLSVVLATKNEEVNIGLCLASVKRYCQTKYLF
jgi:protoporphyrinogen oxidase